MKKAIVILFVVPFLGACEQVDTGFRGVKTVWGEVDEKAGSLPEGLYFYNPITSSIKEVDTRVKAMRGDANTYTKDVQQANIKYVANYHLARDKAHIMYRDVGKGWEDVIVPQIIEASLKKVVGQFEAVDLVAHRAKATSEVSKQIAEALAEKGVVLTNFEMPNLQYLKEFEKSVEAKVVATQRAAQAVNDTKRIQEEARQQVIQAQAQAESMRIRANALTQNKALVEYEAVQKWDGKMPQIITGSGTVPFININK